MTPSIITPATEPLHLSELSALQRVALAGAVAYLGRPLLDPDGYINDDEVSARLHTLADDGKDHHMTSDLTAQIQTLADNIAALHERARLLVTAADHAPATNEDEALALVDALADVRDHLRRTEEPLRQAVWHAEHLDVMPVAYGQGYAAGHAEAVERERAGDATSAADAATWFTAEHGQVDADQYERGFHAGFAEHFAGR